MKEYSDNDLIIQEGQEISIDSELGELNRVNDSLDNYYDDNTDDDTDVLEQGMYDGITLTKGSTVKYLNPNIDGNIDGNEDAPDKGASCIIESLYNDGDIDMVTIEGYDGEFQLAEFEDIDNPIGEIEYTEEGR